MCFLPFVLPSVLNDYTNRVLGDKCAILAGLSWKMGIPACFFQVRPACWKPISPGAGSFSDKNRIGPWTSRNVRPLFSTTATSALIAMGQNNLIPTSAKLSSLRHSLHTSNMHRKIPSVITRRTQPRATIFCYLKVRPK